MINNDQSTWLLYCCEDIKSHRSGGDTVPSNHTYLVKFLFFVVRQFTKAKIFYQAIFLIKNSSTNIPIHDSSFTRKNSEPAVQQAKIMEIGSLNLDAELLTR